jgi:hypothetical protein
VANISNWAELCRLYVINGIEQGYVDCML